MEWWGAEGGSACAEAVGRGRWWTWVQYFTYRVLAYVARADPVGRVFRPLNPTGAVCASLVLRVDHGEQRQSAQVTEQHAQQQVKKRQMRFLQLLN